MKTESQSTTGRILCACAMVLAIVAIADTGARAQGFSVVHNFTGQSDGGQPLSGLLAVGDGGGKPPTVFKRPGNLTFFGTASSGGTFGYGLVFSMNASGSETVLHNFAAGTDGANPHGVLIGDAAGNLYGTTTAGGATGAGTVFEVAGNTETVLYSFAAGVDGAVPEAGLAMDAAGNLYGTTTAGGSSGNGTVFKLAPPKTKGAPWTESVLYSFGTGTDGAVPIAGVSLDAAGNLYGTASAGGAYGFGTVFQLTPGTPWTETILHDFQNATDGAIPYGGLISDASGNFYGATTEGGSNGGGGGTIFELTPSNGQWTFTTLYVLPGWGISGSFRSLLIDASGNLYGTTHCDGNDTAGTVYELSPSGGTWKYKLLYTFTGGTDGLYSFGNLVLRSGTLYGTTFLGGSKDAGVVFRVTL